MKSAGSQIWEVENERTSQRHVSVVGTSRSMLPLRSNSSACNHVWAEAPHILSLAGQPKYGNKRWLRLLPVHGRQNFLVSALVVVADQV